MATGIQTGGYAQASVMPQFQGVDPRLLAANYDSLVNAAGQGLQLVGNFNNQRQLALDRVDANYLRDLRLAAQRGQLELEPQLQRDRAVMSERLALEAMIKPIDVESTRTVNLQNRYGAPTTGFTASSSPEDIEAGILGTYESKANKLPSQDVVVQENRTVYDPATKTYRNIRSVNNVLQTAEQIANVNADNDARIRAIEATRATAEAERKRKEGAASTAEGFRSREVAVREAQEKRLANTPRTSDSLEKRRAALANTVLPSGLKLSDYLLATRNNDGSVRNDSKWYLPAGLESKVATNPQAEALARQYEQLTSQVTDMATQPPAAGSLPTVAAEALPAASLVRQAVQPGGVVRQGGKSYRFDGTNYIEIQ